jgi:uncharacterized membrane protein YczE
MMKKSTPVQFVIRALIYCFALFLLGLGVALSVNSNLGVSPVNSLPYVISQILGVQMGTCVTVIFCLFILLQILILRKDFQLFNLLQIVFSTIFGYFLDGAKFLLGDFCLPGYPGQLVMLAMSIVMIGFSLVLYIDVELAPMPAEGLVGCISSLNGRPFSQMKTAVDCTSVLIAAVLSLLFLGKLSGVREGTVLTALLVGKTMGTLRKFAGPWIQKLCF